MVRLIFLCAWPTAHAWRTLFLINDPSLNRADVSWWANQGRLLFSDLVRYAENLPELGN
ncbi:MAG: hypothetical protein IVW57_03495 [Ktedonobacterales bacterium]|nr:hypothetical protein [Ktedonobacterales bacterium]